MPQSLANYGVENVVGAEFLPRLAAQTASLGYHIEALRAKAVGWRDVQLVALACYLLTVANPLDRIMCLQRSSLNMVFRATLPDTLFEELD